MYNFWENIVIYTFNQGCNFNHVKLNSSQVFNVKNVILKDQNILQKGQTV